MVKLKAHPSKQVTLSAPMLSLLHRAHERFLERQDSLPGDASPPRSIATQTLVHELQVHQIELELQNEELRSSQIALEESREDYFDLYDLAPVGYFTVTENGIILKANLTVASLLETPRGALINKQFTRLIHRTDQDQFYLCRKASLEGSPTQSCELRMRKGASTYFWAQALITLSQNRQGIPELRIILTDISSRKQADEERAQFLRTLESTSFELATAKAAVEEANCTQSNFLSNVTDELRSPLNAILGFSQLLDTGNPTPTPSQKKRIDEISKAGWALLEKVDKIIALASSTAGKLPLKKAR